MAIIRRRKRAGNFTVIDNATINDPNIRESLGLYVYLISKPDNWEANMSDIQSRFGIGRDRARKWMKELSAAGYATLRKRRNESGNIIGSFWDVSEEREHRETENTSVGEVTERLKNRQSVLPTVGKHVPIISTEKETKTYKKTKTLPPAENRENSNFNFENATPGNSEEKEGTGGALDVATLNEIWISKSLSNSTFIGGWRKAMSQDEIEAAAAACAAYYIKQHFEQCNDETQAALSLANRLSKSVGIREASTLHSWIIKEPQFKKVKNATKNTQPTRNSQPPTIEDYRDYADKIAPMAARYAERIAARDRAIEERQRQHAAEGA